jgi:hypothetical protein
MSKESTSTIIKTCLCDHPFQDTLYGRFKRLMNWAPKACNKSGGYRCTVCGREHA